MRFLPLVLILSLPFIQTYRFGKLFFVYRYAGDALWCVCAFNK